MEIPAEQLEQEIDALAQKYTRKAKVPGFRPGKVPLHIVKQRYTAELRSEASQNIIERCWKDAVREHKLQPLQQPSVKELRDEPGGPLKFTLSFEVLPALEIKGHKGLPVSVEPVTVEEKDVDQALELLREQNAQYVPVESGEARDGFQVILTVDGSFEGGGRPVHEDDFTFIVGSPETNETFSENLRGAKPGERRAFDVSYPADYPRKRFAGQLVHYQVEVKDIKEKHLAELGDDFAKELGAENLEQLRNRVRDELVTNAQRSAEMKAREAVIDEVIRRNSFDVPDCLVQDELGAHARRVSANLAQQGIDVNKTRVDWKKVFEERRPIAEQAVRRSIVLDAVARQENIEVTEEELEAELQKIAAGTSKSAAALRAQLEKDEKIQGFREHLLHNKALDFMFRNANISGG